ncbi:tetratricopeptide repeat protein, partial [Candidatus Poribacteria bacterium]|nr:tetratricopeptide repeat protein [Candidatus Poribacteria bacterium]
QLDPGIAVARINLGVMYEKKGMIDEAIEQIQAMVNMQINSATIHGMLGDLYMKKGDFSRAESEFKKALEIDANFGLVYHSLAELYLRQNIKLDEALRYAKKAMELNPDPGFIFTLANIYYKKGMLSDAEREIKRVIQMEPNNEKYQEFFNKLIERKGS